VIEPNCRTRGAMGRHRYHCRPGRANERIWLIARLERCVFSGRYQFRSSAGFISPWLPASNSGRKFCGRSSLIWLVVLPVVASSTTSSTHRA
jgi:hypothetical protein